MIRPSHFIDQYRLKGEKIVLNCGTKRGLGNGGFTFSYSKSFKIYERVCFLSISGEHINPVGPFKKWVTCGIKLSVIPEFDSSYKVTEIGYNYICEYKSTFWGGFYTEDANELCNDLLRRTEDYFERNDKDCWEITDDNNYIKFRREEVKRLGGR